MSWLRRSLSCLVAVLVVAAAVTGVSESARDSVGSAFRHGWEQQLEWRGLNPHPVHLVKPQAYPLSQGAQLGKRLFFDANLSVSGKQSCASCHLPTIAYGPPNGLPAQLGGSDLSRQGVRAVPSLTYLWRTPSFSIGPDSDHDSDHPAAAPSTVQPTGLPLTAKRADQAPVATALVPQGGLFWDGRAATLQAQAEGPLLNPLEMANPTAESVAGKLHAYESDLVRLFGARVLDNRGLLMHAALFAISRFEIEDLSFHPYTSKFDDWLEGRTAFTTEEMRGYRAFNDPHKGNCGACHVDAPRLDWQPPLLTDNEYEALAVPRNPELASNHDPSYFDMGICGPYRTDMSAQSDYCGMFRTPSLRNVARRSVFFHNGRYHSLRDVMQFYNLRDVDPDRIYPKRVDGSLDIYDDMPAQYHRNVDIIDAPFGHRLGEKPPMSEQDIDDIIAFLGTLNDGYQSPH